MKSQLCFISYMFLLGLSLPLQGQTLVELAELPDKLAENSGLEITSENELWLFNDSGGNEFLYLCDTMGNINDELNIQNVINKDWEDIAQDADGNMYIGDFGNNNNDRTDLRIFKIENPKDALEVSGEIIEFSFNDQDSFPPIENLNYDCEAMIWFQDHLYLFTKHRTLPIGTNVYKIPDTPGVYIAEKIDSFFPSEFIDGEHPLFDNWITAADISPDYSSLALLCHNKVWIFSDFQDDQFFLGDTLMIPFNQTTQKEGVCFKNNTSLYITDEELIASIGKKIYLLDLANEISETIQTSLTETDGFYPNPCRNKLYFKGNISQLKIFDQNGRNVIFKNRVTQYIDISTLKPGTYYLSYRKGAHLYNSTLQKL